MPAQVKKSGLLAKLGSRISKAMASRQKDEVDYGSQIGLPPGIRDGVARLTECEFGEVAAGKQNAGQPYFRAAGVVIEPHSVIDGDREIVVAGRQTSIMTMACETKTQAGKVTPLEENIYKIQDHMCKLAGIDNASELFPRHTYEELEEVAAALKVQAPFFNFSTSPRKDQNDPTKISGSWENWHGTKGMESYEPPQNGEKMVQDSTEAAEPAANEESPADEGGELTEFQLMELAGEADGMSVEEACTEGACGYQIIQAAEAISEELAQAVKDADNWESGARLIIDARSGETGGEEEAPAEEEEAPAEEEKPWEPSKSDVVKYQQVDAKGKALVDPKTKKAKKPIEVEILTVNKKSSTVTVKDNSTKKPLLGADGKPLLIKWDKLIVS